MQVNQPKLSVLKIDGMHCAACQAPVERAVTVVTIADRLRLFEFNRTSS